MVSNHPKDVKKLICAFVNFNKVTQYKSIILSQSLSEFYQVQQKGLKPAQASISHFFKIKVYFVVYPNIDVADIPKP